MAQAVEQAQKQRELSKEALTSDLNRLEAKVRSELDVRSRLRRDGARLLALGGTAVVVVGVIVVMRARLRRHGDAVEADGAASLEDVAVELREIRRALEKQGKGGGSFAQKALFRAIAAAGAAGGTFAARQVLSRRAAEGGEGTRRASAG